MGTVLDLLTLPIYIITITGNILCALKGTQSCLTSTNFPLVTLKNWLIIDTIQPILTTLVLLLNFNNLRKSKSQNTLEYYRRSLPLSLMRNIWLGIGVYGLFFKIPSFELQGTMKTYLNLSMVFNFSLVSFRHLVIFMGIKNPFTKKWDDSQD